MTENFENKPIEYVRFKKNYSDKIIHQDGKYQVSRKFITKGYDGLMAKWVKVKTETKLLPIETIGCFKVFNQTVYVKRTAIDSLLKTVELWLKVIRKIEVINKDSNIYLKESCNRVFQTDFNVTAPIPQNSCPLGLKITKLSETPLTKEELLKLNEELNNVKIAIKPIICEENQNGELKLIC